MFENICILSITNLAVSLNSRYFEKRLNKVSHLNKNDIFLSTSQKKYLSVLCHQFWHVFVWNNTILHVDLKYLCFNSHILSTHKKSALKSIVCHYPKFFYMQMSRFWIKVAHYMKYLEVFAPKIDDSSWILVYHEFSDLPY